MFKYLIVIVAVLCGCQNVNNPPNIPTTVFAKFPKQENVTFRNLIKYDHGVISRFFLTDTTLIAYDWRAQGGYFFYEYGLQSKQNIHKYIAHGRGKGQALGALSVGVFNNSVWMYDVILNKIIFSDLKTVPLSTDAYAYHERPFSEKYYNIQFLKSSKIIACGNYQTKNKIQELDLNSGNITADYGTIDDVPENIHFYAWKRANESLMVLNPNRNKAVLAHLFNDNIEIFDLNSHKSVIVKGPENYKIEFKPLESDGDIIEANENSRLAFTSVVATDKFIYALYSGDNQSNPNSIYAKALYIYDWNGKPVKNIKLDRYVSGFTVSRDDKTLYAYDVASRFIVIAKI